MAVKIQLRRDTTEGWELNGDNVVLAEGEIGLEFQENGYTKMKIGDGVQSWNALPYFAETISYNGLDDKPSINGVTLTDDKSLVDFGIQPVGNYVTNENLQEQLNIKQDTLFFDEDSGIIIDENGVIRNIKPNVQANWLADIGDSVILNKPRLHLVATSGSYEDLDDKPTIPEMPDQYILPQATTDTLGGVKIGDGINLTEDGTISVHTKITDYEQLENRPKINGHDLNSESTSWDLGLATIAETKVRLDKKADKTEVEQCALKTDITSVKESLKDYAKLTDLTDIKEQVIVITDKTDKIEEELETKVAKGNVYSKDEIDTKLKEIAVSGGVDLSNYYTKAEVDSIVSDKADKNDTYTKAEVDEDIESLGTSIDNLQRQVNNKANSANVYTKDDVYTKEQIDAMVEEISLHGSASLPLFTPMWNDHILNDASYLRADTFSWHDGEVYKSAYEHLANDMSNKTPQDCLSETISGVTIYWYLADDGHKIVTVDQEANVQSIYNNTGIAWYYIFDSANKRFKLPRTKWGFVGTRGSVGGYVEAGLPNITGSVSGAYGNSNSLQSGALSYTADTEYQDGGDGSDGERINTSTINFNAQSSNGIYGSSTTVQQRSTQMYLYFFVGNTVRNETEIDMGALAEIVNEFDITVFQEEVNQITESAINSINASQNIHNITETRGTIALEADKMYTMTISGTTTFTLPTVTDISKFHQIKLMIKIDADTTINWGTSYFFNKETPDIDSGNSYDVYYDYDNLLGQWVCGVIVKGVE